ncbi:MAG: phosphoglucosamine mutase [Planctomycetota bacterium]|nr:phosphoglucosamine mutase [Planctomycetota bacterium]
MSRTLIASVSGIRGIVGNGLDPTAVLEFAAAYAAGVPVGSKIVVAHDGRPTAAVFVQAVLAGVTASGCHACLVGAAATPTVGHWVRRLTNEEFQAGGIQISASHNPPEYNGLKFFQPEGMVLSPESGRAVLARYKDKAFRWVAWNEVGTVRDCGGSANDGASTLHRETVMRIVRPEIIRQAAFRVVLDGCHGGGGLGGLALLESLGCKVFGFGLNPDGRYDHPPEPTEANLRELCRIVPALNAAVGFAQDPDADRLAILDEKGRYIGEELTLALCARHRLAQQKGPVVLNLSTSRVTEDIAASFECPVERTAVGEINVVTRMREVGAVIGGEGNGGVIDPRVGFVRDSFVGMALVLDLMAESGKPLSVLVDELPTWEMVKEKYALAPDSPPISEMFDRIIDAHPDARADRRDGLRLDWDECWAHVRASNTEPIVRVIAEARDRERAHELANFLGRWVRGDV